MKKTSEALWLYLSFGSFLRFKILRFCTFRKKQHFIFNLNKGTHTIKPKQFYLSSELGYLLFGRPNLKATQSIIKLATKVAVMSSVSHCDHKLRLCAVTVLFFWRLATFNTPLVCFRPLGFIWKSKFSTVFFLNVIISNNDQVILLKTGILLDFRCCSQWSTTCDHDGDTIFRDFLVNRK